MSVTVTKDRMAEILKSMQALVGQRALIGIPQETADRDGPINNAAIGYIMETGSPETNVPARPFLVPGVEQSLPAAMRQLQNGAKGALNGNKHAPEIALERAGAIAQASVQALMHSNIAPALAPSTIRRRKYARKTESRRTSEMAYLANVKGGMDPGDAQSAAGIVSLVNTGELSNAITHILRKDK